MLKKLNLALEEEQLIEDVVETDPIDSVELSIVEDTAPIEEEAGELIELNNELAEATSEVENVETMADNIEAQIEAGEDIDAVALENIKTTIRIVANRWGLPENKRLLNISHESYSQQELNQLAMEGVREWISDAFSRLGKLTVAVVNRIGKFLSKINPFSTDLKKNLVKIETLVKQTEWALTGSDSIGEVSKVSKLFKAKGGSISAKTITTQLGEATKAVRRAEDMMKQVLKVNNVVKTPIDDTSDLAKIADTIAKTAITVTGSKAFEVKACGSEETPLPGNVIITPVDGDNVFFEKARVIGFKLEKQPVDKSSTITAASKEELLKLIELGRTTLDDLDSGIIQAFDDYSKQIDTKAPLKKIKDGDVSEDVLAKTKEGIKFAGMISEATIYFVMYTINAQIEGVRGIANYSTAVTKANGKGKATKDTESEE